MKEVKILGVVIGDCYDFNIIENNSRILYSHFGKSENIYKIFPDFPKSFSVINNLIFDFISGEVILSVLYDSWQIIYKKQIDLNNFKGEK